MYQYYVRIKAYSKIIAHKLIKFSKSFYQRFLQLTNALHQPEMPA